MIDRLFDRFVPGCGQGRRAENEGLAIDADGVDLPHARQVNQVEIARRFQGVVDAGNKMGAEQPVTRIVVDTVNPDRPLMRGGLTDFSQDAHNDAFVQVDSDGAIRQMKALSQFFPAVIAIDADERKLIRKFPDD